MAAERASRAVTETFSSSFGSAIRLLDADIRQDIYSIYGLVRIADEIVDTYQGKNAEQLLRSLESEVYNALKQGYSTNVIVHAFIKTATTYAISKELIEPFFASMQMDLTAKSHTDDTYRTYIHGSAEVVGLMCLKVFTKGSDAEYEQLKEGACALGAAYQKVNFLRDIKDDYETRGRFYFPNTTFEAMNEADKRAIVSDIYADLERAQSAINQLPKKARFATQLSHDYYRELLAELERSPVEVVKQSRLSVPRHVKLGFMVRARIGYYVS